MLYKIVTLDKAKEELIDAQSWYNEQQQGLADRFTEELNAMYDSICLNPAGYQSIRKGFRQAPMTKFPFLVIYYVEEDDSIIYVSAIFHTSRNPKLKFKRK